LSHISILAFITAFAADFFFTLCISLCGARSSVVG
jgi:hypothetical protein